MPSAAEPLHLLIPDARPPLPPGTSAPPLPALAQLDTALRQLAPQGLITADEQVPATAFELALAQAQGLPGEPGRIPWAAFEQHVHGTPCAWLRPCHWQLGMDSVTLVDPAALALAEAESRALLAALQPLLTEDGVALDYVRPDAWLARGTLFRGLRTWSMARAVQHPLTREVLADAPSPAQSALLRRLQSEWQMLLYTHPVNEAREAARQWPVNAVWIDGAGELAQPVAPTGEIVVDYRLAECPPGDTAARAAAWRALDAERFAALAQALRAGRDARLTLAGPSHALTLAPARGWRTRISNVFSPLSARKLPDML